MTPTNTFSVDVSKAAHSDDRVSYVVYQIQVSDTKERFIIRRGDWWLMLESDRPIYRKKRSAARGTYTVVPNPNQPEVDKDLVMRIVEGVEGWLKKNNL